jgi:hypothetical protein
MSDPNPLERKRAVESWIKAANLQIEALRVVRSFEKIKHDDPKDYGRRVELYVQPNASALRDFLIADIQRMVAEKHKELHKLRFECADYLRKMLASTEVEISDAARNFFDGGQT